METPTVLLVDGVKTANIRNCIIYGNTYGDLSGISNNANYCNLQSSHSGNENIYSDPCFINLQENNLHIDVNSHCKNAGDSNGIPIDETDIDGENRIKYGRVDIGADEFYRSPDFDRNGIVNFKDFALFAVDWMKTADFNDDFDLDYNNQVGSSDLQLFCQDWLWQLSWVVAVTFDIGEEQMMMQEQQQNIFAVGQTMELESMTQLTQVQTVITEEDIENAVDWLDSLWLDGSLNNMSESEYQQFRQSVEDSPI